MKPTEADALKKAAVLIYGLLNVRSDFGVSPFSNAAYIRIKRLSTRLVEVAEGGTWRRCDQFDPEIRGKADLPTLLLLRDAARKIEKQIRTLGAEFCEVGRVARWASGGFPSRLCSNIDHAIYLAEGRKASKWRSQG
jgi:hypothetical protein